MVVGNNRVFWLVWDDYHLKLIIERIYSLLFCMIIQGWGTQHNNLGEVSLKTSERSLSTPLQVVSSFCNPDQKSGLSCGYKNYPYPFPCDVRKEEEMIWSSRTTQADSQPYCWNKANANFITLRVLFKVLFFLRKFRKITIPWVPKQASWTEL